MIYSTNKINLKEGTLMKLNKKITSLAILAAMSLSSLTAFAMPTEGMDDYVGGPVDTYTTPMVNNLTVPVPVYSGNKEATYAQAQDLYSNGFYFEAHVVLEAMINSGTLTPAEWAIANVFLGQIEDAIDRVIIEEAFADVEAYMADNYYAEAADILINDVHKLALGLATASTITGAASGSSEILYDASNFTTDDWYRARCLEAKISDALGDNANTPEAAMRRVNFLYDIPADVWMEAVPVGTRTDIYLKKVVFGVVVTVGTIDISNNGDVLRADMGAFTMKPVFNNPVEW